MSSASSSTPPDWLASLSVPEVLEFLVDGVLVTDDRGQIVFWNEAAERITGYPSLQVRGQPASILEGLGCSGFRRLEQLLEGGRAAPREMRGIECRVLGSKGQPVRLFGNARVVRDREGRALGTITCFLDLTAVEEARERAQQLERELRAEKGFGLMVGVSPAMKELFRKIDLAAASDVTVLLEGESGTGKELASRAIHDAGPRARQPFITVHCSALPETLLESELFGHVKGSFTGAHADSKGRFELADGGTLFLDEIGELSPRVQVKLLRAIETREIQRIGEGRSRRVDVRIIAATHRDLKELVAAGDMREDFFYRLRVFPIRVPPLRERREDIPRLAEHFLEQYQSRNSSAPRAFAPDAVRRLVAACWPGNVRELRNAVEYAGVAAQGPLVTAADLPEDLEESLRPLPESRPAPPGRITRERLEAAIEDAGGRMTEAARRLGISRVTLWRLRKKLLGES